MLAVPVGWLPWRQGLILASKVMLGSLAQLPQHRFWS